MKGTLYRCKRGLRIGRQLNTANPYLRMSELTMTGGSVSYENS